MLRTDIDKIRGQRWLTVMLWIVCLCPLWAAMVSNPTTFWQTFTVGCAQVALGFIAIAVTAILNDL